MWGTKHECHSFTKRKCRFIWVLIGYSFIMCSCAVSRDKIYDPKATVRDIFNAERLELTAEYGRIRYGAESYILDKPQMIVIHYSAFSSLKDSYDFFAPAKLSVELRKDISSGGAVNVAAHYLIDRNGAVFQLAPENVICRHTIGFNHTAIGIENVGREAAELTDAQAEADAALVSRIVARHPTIRFLIGHHEYRKENLPHFKLYLEKDPNYRFTEKSDPGPVFMERVRDLLKNRYGISLQD